MVRCLVVQMENSKAAMTVYVKVVEMAVQLAETTVGGKAEMRVAEKAEMRVERKVAEMVDMSVFQLVVY